MTGSLGRDEFSRLLREERARIDVALSDALAALSPSLPPSLVGPVLQGVLAGGKRLRPVLCVAAFRACESRSAQGVRSGSGEREPGIYTLAVSLELIHAYSLMHDDLPCMDDAALRRGEPTPHTVYGERRAIVSGALLIPAAGLQAWRGAKALGLTSGEGRELVGVLARAAGGGGMVGGQGLDLLGEGTQLTRPELDALHRRKTGALLTAALVMGGIAARAAGPVRAALARYGEEVGLAFQIADDILDATGDAETLGKEPSDQALEKSTYVSLLGVHAARREARARMGRAIGALEEAGIESPTLNALAVYAVDRDR